MDLVEVFLNEFCAIEKYLRILTNSDEHKSFGKILQESKTKNRVVSHYIGELSTFANLRNVLSHERFNGSHVALPSESVVERIQELRAKIISQPKLLSLCSANLLTFDKEDTIQTVLLEMRKHDFSQVPILSEGVLFGVLSSNTISRWLGSDACDGLFCTSEVTVEEVMNHQEFSDNYEVLPQDQTYGKAVAKFEKGTSKGKVLDAILITHSGKPEQKLLGIVTMADMPTIMSVLY
jgi:predicted transcriptional regulator